MNKLFKHTKKFMLVAMTLVMMLATSMVVLGANGENELKTLKPAKTRVTLYVNASEAGKADATTTGKVGAEMVPMDSSVDVDVTAVAKVVGATGDFKVESSNPSVASVVKKDISNKVFELGHCYSKVSWGKGYATEAFKKVISFLFDEVGVEVIMAKHYENNLASGKVMLKSGMTYEATLRSRIIDKVTKERVGEVYYSITKDEYLRTM